MRETQLHLDLSDKEEPDREARQAILVISFLKNCRFIVIKTNWAQREERVPCALESEDSKN